MTVVLLERTDAWQVNNIWNNINSQYNKENNFEKITWLLVSWQMLPNCCVIFCLLVVLFVLLLFVFGKSAPCLKRMKNTLYKTLIGKPFLRKIRKTVYYNPKWNTLKCIISGDSDGQKHWFVRQKCKICEIARY